MKINELIKKKPIPSFCTANEGVIKIILLYCKIYNLPCLIECTSNQVNQFGGYTRKTPRKFTNFINNIAMKIKLNKKNIFLGGDHLGPMPWKNLNSNLALKNSVKLINQYIDNKFNKIHIDTSIKCKNDKTFNSQIKFNRTKKILEKIKLKNKSNIFFVVGSEVPISGSDKKKLLKPTSLDTIKKDSIMFDQLIFEKNNKNKNFGLVIEVGMKYLDDSIQKPNFKYFFQKKKFSLKNNFIYEAHSTDFQSINTLKKLVDNNFKFLKVGPELTYSYSRSLLLMEKIEKQFKNKNKSNFSENLIVEMLKNNKHWFNFYEKNNTHQFLNSKYDRSRYYLETKSVKNSINKLKFNINKINLIKFNIKNIMINKSSILKLKKKKLNNFEILNFVFISKSLTKYYRACGFKI